MEMMELLVMKLLRMPLGMVAMVMMEKELTNLMEQMISSIWEMFSIIEKQTLSHILLG